MLVDALPKAELFIIPAASHPCYLDDPNRFHKKLVDFLAKLPQASLKKPTPEPKKPVSPTTNKK